MRIIRWAIKAVFIGIFISSLLLNVGMFVSSAVVAAASGVYSAVTGLQSGFEQLTAKRIQRQRAVTRRVSNRLRTRVVRGAVRDSAAVFAEAVPYIGIAAIVGATTLELKDACDTLKDIRELDDAFEASSDIDEDITTVCGQTVPTYKEVWEVVRTSPTSAWDRAQEVVDRLPALKDLRSSDKDVDWRERLTKWWDER